MTHHVRKERMELKPVKQTGFAWGVTFLLNDSINIRRFFCPGSAYLCFCWPYPVFLSFVTCWHFFKNLYTVWWLQMPVVHVLF